MGIDKAGTSLRVGPSDEWIATLPEPKRQQFFAARPGLEDDWDEQWGDRMIRLVFIGRQFDPEQLVDRLDECVLIDAEMDEDWSTYSDPFEPEDKRELALAN